MVRADIEIVGLKKLNRLIDEGIIEDDAAENGAFGVGAVRQRAFEKLVARRVG